MGYGYVKSALSRGEPEPGLVVVALAGHSTRTRRYSRVEMRLLWLSGRIARRTGPRYADDVSG
jgi:hypothetical protein